MAENQLIIGLKREYARALGWSRAGDDRTEDLAHLAAVILMFSPDADLAAIKSIRPYPRERERCLVEALSVLRRASYPMTARAIARRVLEARGSALSCRNLQRVECSLHAVLGRLEGLGVERVADNPKRWRIEG